MLSAPILLVSCEPANALLSSENRYTLCEEAVDASPEADDRAFVPAQPAQQLTGRVVDDADIIPDDIEGMLTNQLAAIEADTRAQLVVVTTETLGKSSIEDYTRELGNNWGIGDKDRHDGVILLVAPNDRQTRIGVGCGLETTLTNEMAAEIVDDMVEHYRLGDYPNGITTGVDGVEQVLREKLEKTS